MIDPFILLTVTVLSLLFLLILIFWARLHPFVALLLTTLFLGLCIGMPFQKIVKSIENGIGDSLSFTILIIGMGSLFGRILEASGGLQALGNKMLTAFPTGRMPLGLMMIGFLIGIPVYFDVAFILMVPLIYSLAKSLNKSVLWLAIPFLAGLSVAHSFIPPTPGPVAVAGILNADSWNVTMAGIIIGIPVAFISGPVFGKYAGKRICKSFPDGLQLVSSATEAKDPRPLPSWKMVLAIFGLPLILIILSSLTEFGVGRNYLPNHLVMEIIQFVGHPLIALLISVLLASWLLCTRRGYSREEILSICIKALAPAGMIILIIGAGGTFKEMLIESGVGQMLAHLISQTHMSPLVLAYLIAAAVRIMIGSATVSMITAATIIQPLLDAFDISDMHRALIVLSIAAGSTIFSHMNDTGFWLVGKYLRLTEGQTFKSWSVMETIISVSGFIFILLYSLFI